MRDASEDRIQAEVAIDIEGPLDPQDVASWASFLPTVRVGGALPVTFRPDGEYIVVEVIVPYVQPAPAPSPPDAAGKIQLPLLIADGFLVPLAGRYRMPAFSSVAAARFLRRIVREIYHHEIDEQFRVDDLRPFNPHVG